MQWQKFQFPTGWNSTILVHCLLWLYFCFNSQRDGILHNATGYVMKYITFQFPTGWNSTICMVFVRLATSAFQFPTGWNSTKIKQNISFSHKKFQFPTGWNSTDSTIDWDSGFESFNSQRDGILRSDDIYKVDWRNTFQFPTGWNST